MDGKEKTLAINPIKKSYFPKPPERKYHFDGQTKGAVMAQPETPPRQIAPRVFLTIFAIGLIGYTLTHGGVRIDVEVDISDWQGEKQPPGPAAKDTQMTVIARALMNELARQGIFPESVAINRSTISITAPKAPTTGTRLGDMVDNMKDCHVGGAGRQGTSVNVAMLQNTTSCKTLFTECNTSVDATGQPRLNIALTSDGRVHFADFQDTMVFAKAAYPIASIHDYRLEDDSHLIIRSSLEARRQQQRELSLICDAMMIPNRLEGVAFKSITTSRIGLSLPTF
jgi:hypothetical protein